MLPATINIFEKAARKAGRILSRDFGEIENLQIQSKSVGDFVTSADLKVEQSILETLKYYYPDANYLTEESGHIKGDGETIIIDPIDGTSNFIHGIPHVAIVIAKMINNEITDGVVYNPILNEFYWASLGKGSWCNNKRLRVSKRHELTNCLVGTGIPFSDRVYDKFYTELDNLAKKTAGIRRLGSAALDLAYVSSGKIDGFWERDLNLWDICSGVLLVKEAGGRISEPNGNKWTTNSRDITVSNSLIHDKLIENLTLL
jgi:myo-inositol-1(or 4)-monophosphatase|tara:strand:+ start:1027 stop:1803 length:777 start_codon:yes stop_codon:yes gene_type:complete